MFAEKHYLEALAPEELDRYLAKGWYRMGQTMFTTHFLCFGKAFYSAIWVRLPLQRYRFRKSLRKLYRRNTEQFRVVVEPASIDLEKERLYRRYKAAFSGVIAPNLHSALLDGEETDIFNTQEVRVYDGQDLVALSYFDLGKDSVASILGIYDPAYQKQSLGFFTILEEIDYAIAHGYRYYYPGYVVPGYPRFDYKLRIGRVEHYRLSTQQWHQYEEEAEQVPIQMMEQRLLEMQQYLLHQGYSTEQLYYPLFEANLFGFWSAPYLDYPLFLMCSPRKGSRQFLLVVFNPVEEAYQLLHASLFDDLQLYFNHSYTESFDQRYNFVDLLTVEAILESSTSPSCLFQVLRQQLGA